MTLPNFNTQTRGVILKLQSFIVSISPLMQKFERDKNKKEINYDVA